MLRSMVTSILCWVFREAEKLRCGVVTKDQWRLPRRNCWDSSGLDNGNPMSRSAAGHNSHTTGCNELILEVLKCRRGDLNPHGTRSRQILSLLRMPISPLRRRFSSAVYQNTYRNPFVLSPGFFESSPLDARPGYSSRRTAHILSAIGS